jgi:ectoine hydroxylase-related dioxygenase (phytanoyl-CoA dioxygenase family)
MDIEAIRETFDRNGYVTIERLFDVAEVEALRAKTRAVLADAVGIPGETKVFDVEESHTAAEPRVRRIKRPHEVDPLYWREACNAKLVRITTALLGPSVRLHHSKINLKSAKYGSPLEWHQDWAFIPHTNMDLAICSVMLDEVGEDNGPMLVIPGTHKGPLMSHHDGEWFVGAIPPETIPIDRAVKLMGPPGTVTFHHPLLVHGSALNTSSRERWLLFYEYAAADAWPLIYTPEWTEYMGRLVCGEPSPTIRLESVAVTMPLPVRDAGSIYNNQRAAKKRFFATFEETSGSSAGG